MRRLRPATACASVAALVVGCAPVVAGRAKPAPNLKPRPLTGSVLRRVPLDNTALSRMLERPFVHRQEPVFGGPDKLGDAGGDGSPTDQMISVIEGVAAFRSAAQAQALFAKFPPRWQQCKDATTTEQTGPIKTTTVVNDIRVTDSVVAATNTATAELPNMEPLQATPQSCAVGVRLNCIVDVEVVFFGDRHPSDPGSVNPDTSAVDVAHAMMARIDKFS